VGEAREVVHAAGLDALAGRAGSEQAPHPLARPLHHGGRGVDRPHVEPPLDQQDRVPPPGAAEVEHAGGGGAVVCAHQLREPVVGSAGGEPLHHLGALPEGIRHRSLSAYGCMPGGGRRQYTPASRWSQRTYPTISSTSERERRGCGGMSPNRQWCARTPRTTASTNAASAWCPGS